MISLPFSIPVDQHMNMSKFDHNNQPKRTPISACERSQSAWIDLVILVAVISAFGFLIYPYFCQSLQILETIMFEVKQEVLTAPMIYGCLGLSLLIASLALLVVTLCSNHNCGRSGCRGLQKGAEFDIQLETDDCVKKDGDLGLKKGLFELPRDYHRELEAELKKMAPMNGRAVLVFRARCGCCVGRMEVPGPKKNSKKVKK